MDLLTKKLHIPPVYCSHHNEERTTIGQKWLFHAIISMKTNVIDLNQKENLHNGFFAYSL